MVEGRRIDTTTILVILVILLFLDVGGIGTKFSGWLKTEAKGIQDASVPECLHDRVTMTIGRHEDIFKPTNDVTHLYSRVFINGKDRGLYVDGSTITMTYNDEVEVYYAINASEYYANVDNFNVPCASAFASSELGEAYRVYKSNNEDSTNISDQWYCWRPADKTKQSSSNKIAVSSGQYYTVECEFDYITYEAFSPVGKPAICFDYGSSNFTDRVKIINGNNVNVPGNLDTTFGDVNTMECWDFPNLLDKTVKYRILLYPAQDSPGDIKMYLIDQDYFRNSRTGDMVLDYVDEFNQDLGSLYEVTQMLYFS